MKSVQATALGLALCMGAAHDALAQQAAASATTPSQLAEVIVTAQRRSENLQNVPIAVTAVSNTQLRAANIQTTAALANVTPALTFSNVNGFLEPRIRGIGSSSAGASVENSVATYVDGVYISSATGSLMDLSNVQRVEVLKGPQGTLFGRNATGGLVQVITADPKSTFSGNADVGYGNYDTSHADLYLTGPLTKDVNADLSLAAAHQGNGYGTNIFNGRPANRVDAALSARSKIMAQLGKDTTVKVSFDIAQTNGSDPTPAILSGSATTNYKSGGVPVIVYHSPWDIDANGSTEHRLLTGGASVRLDQKFGAVTLSDILAYRGTYFDQLFDADQTPNPVAEEHFVQHDHQISEEIQLAPSEHDSKVQWVVGLYYYHLYSAFDPFTLTFSAPPTQHATVLRDFLTTESIAGYGQATVEVLPQTDVTAGIRYTQETRSISGSNAVVPVAGPTTVTNIPDASFSNSTPTWRLSIDHKFEETVLGYISYNRGFKSGGYNSSSPAAPAYAPEYLDAYEAGVKSLFLDRRLRVNAAAFLYEYKNIQVNTYLGSVGVIYNGARAEEYGLDLDFDYALTDSLTINGALDALHDRFTSFPKAVTEVPNGDGTVSPIPGGASATGHRLPFAPDATASLGFDYKFDIGGGRTDLVLSDLYSTGFFSQADNLLRQGAYHMVDASLTWHAPDNRYSIKFWVNNAANAAVAEFLSASTTQAVSYQPPRTFGATLGLKF